jgi:hypothetical protein
MADQVSPWDIVVPDRAYRFLRLQRGGLDHFKAKGEWCNAYRQSLLDDYQSIKHWLPAVALDQWHYTLDIGGGMSGLSIMIHRHYGGHTVPCILDGRADRPVVRLHRRTFSDYAAAADFHAANSIPFMHYIDANVPPLMPIAEKAALIISTKAWCFHFPPSVYLDYVVDNAAPGATLIVDVRKDKTEWMAQLQNAFRLKAMVHGERKYDRAVFTI